MNSSSTFSGPCFFAVYWMSDSTSPPVAAIAATIGQSHGLKLRKRRVEPLWVSLR